MAVFRYRKFLYVAIMVCFVVFVVWPFVTGGRSSMIQTEFEPVNAQIEALIVNGEETALESIATPGATFETTETTETSTPNASPAAPLTSITSESPSPKLKGSQSPSPSTGLLDLNTATLKQLNDLPGIGDSKAKAILEYRLKKGRFSRVEELTEVKGIGDKMLEKLKPFVYVTST
ncbi:helix-hairpin-helix domain-containing protein [Paenibacillus anseongense]|uniref:ComEA family DNA-binding protein n=1 Tax=Paenibacillus TaxID=44249 RepID=UPI002DBAECFD|nr:helix-hairpin-helix domain-containing protein [Paenibacillus anseongense]MEC0265991.1 helix-hairpin-helix domain-containing protein [Paenibacillus anseongense]